MRKQGVQARKQIAVGDPFKPTRQCQQNGRGSVRGRERGTVMVWKKRTNEKVMRR